jgi:hypothetical protein
MGSIKFRLDDGGRSRRRTDEEIWNSRAFVPWLDINVKAFGLEKLRHEILETSSEVFAIHDFCPVPTGTLRHYTTDDRAIEICRVAMGATG